MTQDPLFSVAGKVVVLTGAAGLIGRTLAHAFSERNARLVLIDLHWEGVEALRDELRGEVLTVAADVGREEEVARLVAQTQDAYGRADVLINGHQYKPKGFLEAQPEHFPTALWDAVIEANLRGTFLTCRDFGRLMIEQGGGSIINFASTYGVVSSNPALYADNTMGNPLAYTVSKGGVIMLTKYLGAYWGRHGVRVNCVTPHGVYNEHEPAFVERFGGMSPLGRMSRAEEVVGAVLFLASEASSYATGMNLLVEGGWTAW